MDDNIITGYSVLAYSVCPREAWFVLRRFTPDQDNPYIELGRFLHKNSYEGKGEKEIKLPGAVIDLIWNDNKCTIVGEIKKSSKSFKGAKIQLLYYLKLLKDMGIQTKGEILLPKEKREFLLCLMRELQKRYKIYYLNLMN